MYDIKIDRTIDYVFQLYILKKLQENDPELLAMLHQELDEYFPEME